MQRVHLAGLSTLIVLAACACGGADASPENPEFVACGKVAKVNNKGTGAWTDKTCAFDAPNHEGDYERVPLKPPHKFEFASETRTLYLYNTNEKTVEVTLACVEGTGKGELLNSREATMTMTYEGCKSAGGPLAGPCTAPGVKKAGRIVSNPLVAKLVWINEAESVVGIDLSAATEGMPLETAQCAGGDETAELFGSSVGAISPTGESTKLLTASFNASETNGEPLLAGYWDNGAFVPDRLHAVLTGAQNHPFVPVGETSSMTAEGYVVLVDDHDDDE